MAKDVLVVELTGAMAYRVEHTLLAMYRQEWREHNFCVKAGDVGHRLGMFRARKGLDKHTPDQLSEYYLSQDEHDFTLVALYTWRVEYHRVRRIGTENWVPYAQATLEMWPDNETEVGEKSKMIDLAIIAYTKARTVSPREAKRGGRP